MVSKQLLKPKVHLLEILIFHTFSYRNLILNIKDWNRENLENNMNRPKVIDRRGAWLDAVSVDVVEVLAKLTHRKLSGVELTKHEESMSELCSGYLYLLKLAKEHGLFDSDDPFNLFEKETLH